MAPRPLNPQDLATLLERADAEAARRSLSEFVRQGFPIIEPADPYQHNWHVDAVSEHLEAVSRGQIQKLAINIPPGTLKSSLVAVCWPAWVWTWRPEWRGLFSSYAQDLAVRDAVKSRTLMESEWYQRSFVHGRGPAGGPLWRFSDDMNRKDMFSNTRTGFRFSLSVGSKATGFRGNAVVVDDPLNAKEAPSKLARDEVIYWWDKAMSSRVNRPDEDAHVIVMQRLHEDDLTGHVLRGLGYEHLCLPSEFNPKRRSVTFRRPILKADGTRAETRAEEVEAWHAAQLGGNALRFGERERFFEDPRRDAGELLFPARFSAAYLAAQKVVLGAEGYAGQHDQDPSPPEGGLIKRAWWRFWRHEGASAGLVAGTSVTLDRLSYPRPEGCYAGPAEVIPAGARYVIGSLDAAFKGLDTSDYVVFGVWAVHGARRYLLEVVRGKMDYPGTKAAFRALRARWTRCLKFLVEDKANGSAIVSELQAEVPGIIAVNPEGGKEARAAAMSPQIEAGQVYLPDGAPWVQEYVDEHALFPRGRNDDQVDMTSQLMNHLTSSREAARAAMLFDA